MYWSFKQEWITILDQSSETKNILNPTIQLQPSKHKISFNNLNPSFFHVFVLNFIFGF